MEKESNPCRVLRKRLGITQEALAKLLGVSRHTVTYIENGRTPLSEPLALKLALVTGCSLTYTPGAPAPIPDIDDYAVSRYVMRRMLFDSLEVGTYKVSVEFIDSSIPNE